MTTKQFIGKAIKGEIRSGGKCSSVFFEGNTVYSYGYHYPLLTNINGAWILNDSGYSNTTAKHISWAREFAQFVASFSSHTRALNEAVAVGVQSELAEKQGDIATMRQGTKKSQKTLDRIKELTATKEFLLKHGII
jgi:hypothetical protein